MTQELTKVLKAEEIAEEAIDMFDKVSRQVNTPAELAEQTGLSLKTIYNRINQGQEIVNEQIRKNGPKYFADVWRRYEYIWEQAKIEWLASKNSKFLMEMRAVLEAFRKMQALDAAPKAPVGEDGKVAIPAMVMVFSEAEYELREKQAQLENTVEGTFVESPSTKVPLTETEIDDKLTAE